jgi:hypothetical protein
VFSGPTENGFRRIYLLEHRYACGLTTLKTKDAFARGREVAILTQVKRLYSRWRPLLIEVQENL